MPWLGRPMTAVYEVAVDHLYLRSQPLIDPRNIISTLDRGQVITCIDQSEADWWKTEATVAPKLQMTGYVCAKYLTPARDGARSGSWTPPELAAGVAALLPVAITGVQESLRSTAKARHAMLSDSGAPTRVMSSNSAERVKKLTQIIGFLQVEESKRYHSESGHTFCNIYACDYSYLASAYLPRVWWNDRALASVLAGRRPPVQWGTTVSELTANELFDWLNRWGTDLGWTRCTDLDVLQDKANWGGVGVICAQRLPITLSGHITVVVPESDTHRAVRTAGLVSAPLQSQAGATNFEYFCDAWWQRLATRFRAYGYWYHE